MYKTRQDEDETKTPSLTAERGGEVVRYELGPDRCDGMGWDCVNAAGAGAGVGVGVGVGAFAFVRVGG